MTALLACGGLFLAALAAGSILPMQSEAVLAGLLVTTGLSPVLLVLVATIGNVAGSCLNWLLGRWIEHYRDRPWFPASPAQLARAQAAYHRYGRFTLLLSWVPVIGDPLTVVAGIMRESLPVFLFLVTIAKLVRYIVVAALTLNLVG